MAKTKDLFEEALAAEGITGQLAEVARSIYKQESGGGKNTKTSNAGAVGGMQILPATFASVADKGWDINDPMMNARAGIRYIKQMDKLAGGDPALIAAGYYGGPGGLQKAKQGIAVSDPRNPKAPNTLQYGQQVAARLNGGKAKTKTDTQPVEVANVTSVELPAPEVVAAAQPVPVAPVEPMPQTVPVMASGPDPWAEFQERFRTSEPVRAADLQYGPMPTMNVQVPNFMAAVGQNRAIDFSGFGNWGARA